MYVKGHLPFKELSIWRGFLFDDDTVGLRVKNKGYTQLDKKDSTPGELGFW